MGCSGDFPSLYRSIPLFSVQAKEVTETLLADSVEFLPVNCLDNQHFIVNIT